MTRPITRAGHIAYGRNRFCGADVFTTLAREVVTPTDAIDLGIAPHRAGMVVATMMTHTFIAHALQACDDDGPLREIGFAHVAYRGRPPRRSSNG